MKPKMISTLAILLAVSAELFFSAAEAAQPAPGSFVLFPERVVLKDGGFYDAERCIFFVPENRSKSNGKVVSIEVYRFKATEKADSSTPPIFRLPGGPRFRGLGGTLSEPGNFERQILPYLDVADVVYVSQRGIGPSMPSTVIETTTAPVPIDAPYDDARAAEAYRSVLTKEKAMWETAGVDLNGFTVVEAAADVRDVARALGYEKVTLWGGSFGSHWSMAVLRYHPEIVERAVLSAMEGPDHTYDHPGHTWRVYERVAGEAEAAPELAGYLPEEGMLSAIEEMLVRISVVPVTVTVGTKAGPQTVLFDGESVKRVMRGYSGGLAAWPADMLALLAGDFEKAAVSLVKALSESERELVQYREESRFRNAGRTFLTASYFALDCGSGITASRLAEYDADRANHIIGEINWKYKQGCQVFSNDLGDTFRQNFETDIPTVIVHGTWDLSTPYENALELRPYFKNSKFVTVKRGPHGSLSAAMRQSEDFRQAIYTFAATGDTTSIVSEVELPVKWVLPK